MFHQSTLLELDTCLACGSKNLKLTLDLNDQPLANSFKDTKDKVQDKYPLAIDRCTDCYHVQLTHAVNPELMFKNYLYVSGTSQTMKKHFKWFADYAYETYSVYTHTDPKNVMDIGCNDGSQLNAFKMYGMKTVGIDPAENLLEKSLSAGHRVYPTFLDSNFVLNHDETYDIVTAQNVFAHNYDPLTFMKCARKLMHNCSLFFIQTSQCDMILNNEFDTIYHEHISFFNVKSMNELCKRAGLVLVDVHYMPIHGTSFVFVIANNPEIHTPFVEGKIDQLIEIEKINGMYDEDTYVRYAKRCDEVVTQLKYETDYVQQGMIGWNVVGYGAAAKGMTLLNYSKIKLDFIVDDNPLKQGRFTPGSSIPIVSSDKIDDLGTTLFVPLAWNFFDEIRKKIKERRNKEEHKYDRFITYFPRVEIKE